MQTMTYKKGEYSQFRFVDGSRLFLETLPNIIRIKKMILGIIPTKTLWTYQFPFYIRTATEAWETSIRVLDLVLEAITDCSDSSEFYQKLTPKLDQYVKDNEEVAKTLALDKLGPVAFRAER